MDRKIFTRAVALFLAVLMLGGVVMAAVQAFALSPETAVMIANTGDNNTKTIVIVVAVVAVVALGASTVLPKVLKKK